MHEGAGGSATGRPVWEKRAPAGGHTSHITGDELWLFGQQGFAGRPHSSYAAYSTGVADPIEGCGVSASPAAPSPSAPARRRRRAAMSSAAAVSAVHNAAAVAGTAGAPPPCPSLGARTAAVPYELDHVPLHPVHVTSQSLHQLFLRPVSRHPDWQVEQKYDFSTFVVSSQHPAQVTWSLQL